VGKSYVETWVEFKRHQAAVEFQMNEAQRVISELLAGASRPRKRVECRVIEPKAIINRK